MKKNINLAFLLITIILFSCNKENSNQIPEKVILSGKVLNHTSEIKNIFLSINRPGLGPLQVYTKIDSEGFFSTSFELYIPTDAWLRYKTNFLVLLHPGDSIYVEFDGQLNNKPDILKTIRFGGDAKIVNSEAAILQKMYFSHSIYTDRKSEEYAVKNYNLTQYCQHLDSTRIQTDNILNNFIAHENPCSETKFWAASFLNHKYYDRLAIYPYEHAIANNLRYNPKDIPDNYIKRISEIPPLSKKSLLSGYAWQIYSNRYLFMYIDKKHKEEIRKTRINNKVKNLLTQKQNDSIRIQSIIKYTPDKLLRQVVLTEFFKQKIERSNSIIFEQFYDVAKNNIQEPFLWEPLLDLYNTKKNQNEIPKEYTTNLMIKSQNSSVKEVMDSIITTNQGKVIYLDCWATWCGPCKAEMPRSKQLMQNTNPDQVAFVFVCVDSDKKNWEKILMELDIKGQHYFLTKEQSDEFRKVFNIRAVPYYCLFDKSGTIIDKGNHLRPDFIKEKLESLL